MTQQTSQLVFWTCTPAPEAPKPMASSRPTIVPEITVNPPSQHPTVAANRVPGYDQGMALSNALPMHIAMPVTSTREDSGPWHYRRGNNSLRFNSTLFATTGTVTPGPITRTYRQPSQDDGVPALP